LISGITIALYVILAYLLAVTVLWKSGAGKRHGISFIGPLLMLRTERGKNLLKSVSRLRRFWIYYATFSRYLFIAGMIAMVALLLWEATLVLHIPRSSAPSLQTYLLLPGINPFVPLGYGILGIVIAVVFHELCHGVLSEAQDIDVESMGVLMLVVPVGAFVEPNQKQLESVSPIRRIRVYGVGPATNIFIALLFLLLFLGPFMGGVHAPGKGVTVTYLYSDRTAPHLTVWSQLLSINGTALNSPAQLNGIDGLVPGRNYSAVYMENGRTVYGSVEAGVEIVGTVPGSPAQLSGIKDGWIMKSMNGTLIYNIDTLLSVFNSTHPGENVPYVFITVSGAEVQRNITLEAAPGSSSARAGIGFLGIYFDYMGIYVDSTGLIVNKLKHPFYGATTPSSYLYAGLRFLVLPFEGLSPIPVPLENNLIVSSPGGGSSLFWISANSMYWVFWINLWVGLFNMLPIIPFDGGYLFKDNLSLLLSRTMKRAGKESRERAVTGISMFFSFLILVLILWQVIGPRLF